MHTSAHDTAPLAAAAPADAEMAQFLTFQLGGEMFALGIVRIREIIGYCAPTVVPMMPASVRGVINLRGTVVPVIDLQQGFGRPSTEVTKRSCIVLVETDDGNGNAQVVGLVVDAVSEVLDLAAADISPPPDFGTRIRREFIQGMGRIGERFVVVLDVEALLRQEHIDLAAVAA